MLFAAFSKAMRGQMDRPTDTTKYIISLLCLNYAEPTKGLKILSGAFSAQLCDIL